MHIIDNQSAFDETCAKLLEQEVLFMDTEFHRKRTYYAKLSIIQVAYGSERVIIDAQSGIDLLGFKKILANENIVKVFHAPEQDFEIFFNLYGELPKNIFDTQTAAGVAGLDGVMGYARLCKELLHVNLDKTMQQANWLVRPLAKELLDYAIKDVDYLIPLYRELSKTITERNLWDAYKTRSEKLIDQENYKPRPEKIMRKMNLNGRLEKFQKNLLHFIELREECAQNFDIPRGFCAPDQDLIQLCQSLPITDKELFKLHLAGKALLKNKWKDKLLSLCAGLRDGN
jgi:ribonuclease D